MLLCNLCHCEADGIAYRASCRHFFCPKCARKSFQSDTFCPICSHSLGNGDVVELTIGMPNSGSSFVDVLFQNALQNTSWDSILTNVERISAGVVELNTFIFSQLCVEIKRTSKAATTLQKDNQQQSQHLVSKYIVTATASNNNSSRCLKE